MDARTAVEAPALRSRPGSSQRVGGSRPRRRRRAHHLRDQPRPAREVAEGRFREDLYYRLHVVPVHLPPLRDRGEDVLPLARSFLTRCSMEEGRQFDGFAPECEQLLLRRSWPGNVRELENVVRNIVVLNDAALVTLPMLPSVLLHGLPGRGTATVPSAAAEPLPEPTGPAVPSLHAPGGPNVVAGQFVTPAAVAGTMAPTAPRGIVPLWQVERDAIEAAIEHHDGNVPRAAAALEISPSTIYRKRQSWADPLVQAAGGAS